MRWWVTILILTALRENSAVQIFLLQFLSAITQILLILIKPMSSSADHKLSLLNEILVSIYLYALLSLTGYQENTQREQTGQVLLCILLTSIAVNFGKFLIVFTYASYKQRG